MYFVFNRYLSARTVLIWLSEFSLIYLTASLAVAIRFGFEAEAFLDYDPYLLKTTFLTLTYMLVIYYFDLYTPELYRPGDRWP